MTEEHLTEFMKAIEYEKESGDLSVVEDIND
jgi:hypothetical protein